MFNAAFYAIIIPFGLLLSMLSLILTFWIDKVNILIKIFFYKKIIT